MIAGITGHRKLQNIEWIKSTMKNVISEMGINYGITCLATGADELFAELLRQENINYTAVIPCINYEVTFEKEELKKFVLSKSRALKLIELNNDSPSEKAFDEAGNTVVDNSEILIAIWNGQEAKGLGGTADIVEYAKSKNQKIIHINPITKSKIIINHG